MSLHILDGSGPDGNLIFPVEFTYLSLDIIRSTYIARFCSVDLVAPSLWWIATRVMLVLKPFN